MLEPPGIATNRKTNTIHQQTDKRTKAEVLRGIRALNDRKKP